MALIMNDEQRSEALKEYNPKERLIQVGKDKQSGKAVLYYPAAWRLYELHLRYPNANFKSEIIYHDEQKGTVIVKAYLYLGKNYEESDKKAEAMKQGSLASLDKVETAAKARCARDFGIGTEYALDMVADETDATHDDASQTHQNGQKPRVENAQVPSPRNPVDQLKREALEARFITGKNAEELLKAWKDRLRAVFQRDVTDDDLLESEALRATLRAAIERYVKRNAEAATSGK